MMDVQVDPEMELAIQRKLDISLIEYFMDSTFEINANVF